MKKGFRTEGAVLSPAPWYNSHSPYLATWMDNHSLKENPDASLWVGIGTKNKGYPLDYSTVRRNIEKFGKKAGISKRIYYLNRRNRQYNHR
ncbi:MAG: hypothetical protein ACE5K4_09380 [Candidatus Hydrothermarchaeota archaeon]